jgi:hypothetical protein
VTALGVEQPRSAGRVRPVVPDPAFVFGWHPVAYTAWSAPRGEQGSAIRRRLHTNSLTPRDPASTNRRKGTVLVALARRTQRSISNTVERPAGSPGDGPAFERALATPCTNLGLSRPAPAAPTGLPLLAGR